MLDVLEEPYTFTKTGGKASVMNVQNVQNHIYQPLATLFSISFLRGVHVRVAMFTLPVSQSHCSDLATLGSTTPGQLIIATLGMKAFLGKEPQLWHSMIRHQIWFDLPWKKKYLILRLYTEAPIECSVITALLFWFAEFWQGGFLNFNVCQFLTSSQRLK